MSKIKDLTGQRFGRLTVIRKGNTDTKAKTAKWLCRCDCGNEKVILARSLQTGKTQSCGCLQKEKTREASIKHGLPRNRVYLWWIKIRSWCNNRFDDKFPEYGGKGIKICDEWSEFLPFNNHVSSLPNVNDMNYLLARIDDTGNFEPGNVVMKYKFKHK